MSFRAVKQAIYAVQRSSEAVKQAIHAVQRSCEAVKQAVHAVQRSSEAVKQAIHAIQKRLGLDWVGWFKLYNIIISKCRTSQPRWIQRSSSLRIRSTSLRQLVVLLGFGLTLSEGGRRQGFGYAACQRTEGHPSTNRGFWRA
ncbi:merozoite surface protein 9 [Elysia marginata]|uniref:Merozoite surface protein 9 n=1 Tax=Elysia marginata TaxID=1093978 RepID=A0AAV4FZJ5_9GAST|nr:merozoite surface protein 9 [Elysia marginata]